MSVTAGIISGFDQARRTFRDAELKKVQGEQDREFSILSALAQHIDPELAAVGASGLLNLAGNPAKTGKGMRGFLGEVDASSHMPQLQALFGAGGANAAPTPGSAAQPDSAAVDPERVANGPGIGAPPAGPDLTPGTGMAASGTLAPPGLDDGGGGPPALDPGGALGMGTPPGPPPPETAQQRQKRLFPSAGDVAAEQTFKNLKARLDAVMGAIRTAKSPDEVDLVRGIAGAPRRATSTKPMNAEYRGADGQEMSGTVIFDPATGQAEVDGQPVTILKMLPTNAPRPIRVNVKGADGNVAAEFRDPNNLEAPALASIPTGMPPSAPPSAYSGTVTTDEGVFQVDRGGGRGPRLGDRPAQAGALSPEQQEATGWLTDVSAAVKAQLSTFNQNRPPGMKATSLPVEQQNALVARISKGRYKTLGELTAATKRAAGAGGSTSTGSARDRANRVRQRLEGADPARVQGTGLPPGMD